MKSIINLILLAIICGFSNADTTTRLKTINSLPPKPTSLISYPSKNTKSISVSLPPKTPTFTSTINTNYYETTLTWKGYTTTATVPITQKVRATNCRPTKSRTEVVEYCTTINRATTTCNLRTINTVNSEILCTLSTENLASVMPVTATKCTRNDIISTTDTLYSTSFVGTNMKTLPNSRRTNGVLQTPDIYDGPIYEIIYPYTISKSYTTSKVVYDCVIPITSTPSPKISTTTTTTTSTTTTTTTTTRSDVSYDQDVASLTDDQLIKLVDINSNRRTYEITRPSHLSTLFSMLEQNHEKFNIISYAISQATLEDVFMTLTKDSAAQDAVDIA